MTPNRWIRIPIFFGFFFLLATGLAGQDSKAKKNQKVRAEEREDYFKKWLEEDVVYIITSEEKAVFEKLTNDLEREQFIEQFWTRRDDDPRTAQNEYKEEHYRRIAFANERYAAGYPGWLTDRGRIYITFGAPDQVSRHSSGETYDRPLREGGGTTNTYPYEVWRYRHIEEVGDDIELEFVDRNLSGEFRLAVSPEEKDALWNVGISGRTLMEELGMAYRRDRGTTNQRLGFERERDTDFRRFETYTKLLSPKPIRYKDLQEIVGLNTQFVDLPFEVQRDFVHLNENQVLAVITLQLENKNLQFQAEENSRSARIAVYGIVTSLTRQVVFEFDDDLELRYPLQSGQTALSQESIYQKVIPLDRTSRHKITLVVKDLNSERIGTKDTVLNPPGFQVENLVAGPLILADSIQTLSALPDLDEMFVLGDVKVRPSLKREFSPSNPLGIYCQLYNVQVDGASGKPALVVTYRVSRGGEVVTEAVDEIGQSMHSIGASRVVLLQRLNLRNLEPGDYRLEIIAQDQISGQRTQIGDSFKVVAGG